MKKALSLVLAAALAAGALSGCGSGAQSNTSGNNGGGEQEKTAESNGSSSGGVAQADAGGTTSDGKYDLVFWVYSDAVLNDQGKLFDQWVKEYCEENPKVNSITLIGKNDSDLLTSLMAGVGLPDMFFASARNMLQYKDAIDLLDLTPVYDSEEGYKDGFYDTAINAVSQDGGMWAIPFMSYVPIIFRNTDVLEKAGIDWKNEPLTSWDVFFDECEKVKAAGIDATHSWAQGGYYCPGAVLASDAQNLTVGVENGETTLKPEQTVRTFETIKKLESYSNGMSYNDDAASEAFKSNELGFICVGPWNEPDYIQAGTHYDVQLIPSYDENGWTGGLQGWDFMYGINTGDEDRNEAIRGWLKKMGSYEVQQKFAQVIGRSMLREDVMDDPETQKTEMLAILAKGLKCGMNQMDFGHSSVFWTSAIGDVAPGVANGSTTPEDGAQQFIDAINGLYAEAGE